MWMQFAFAGHWTVDTGTVQPGSRVTKLSAVHFLPACSIMPNSWAFVRWEFVKGRQLANYTLPGWASANIFSVPTQGYPCRRGRALWVVLKGLKRNASCNYEWMPSNRNTQRESQPAAGGWVCGSGTRFAMQMSFFLMALGEKNPALWGLKNITLFFWGGL